MSESKSPRTQPKVPLFGSGQRILPGTPALNLTRKVGNRAFVRLVHPPPEAEPQIDPIKEPDDAALVAPVPRARKRWRLLRLLIPAAAALAVYFSSRFARALNHRRRS